VSQFLSEELGEGSTPAKRESTNAKADAEEAAARRRALLSTMTQHGAALLELHIQAASHYLQQGMGAGGAQQTEAGRASWVAVGAALDAIGAAAAWLPMRVLRASALADACLSLMQMDDFRGHVVEVLLQVRTAASGKQLRVIKRLAHCVL
jgi:hypothetical protein